jgi:tRNA(adenine34) deaminase
MCSQKNVDSPENFYMASALALAERAFSHEEIPVGALVVYEGMVVGRGYNQSLKRRDPTAHAEVLALRQAARALGNYRLTRATLYCTLEPCVMCAGAMVWARIQRLVYGAKDVKAGAIDSHLGVAQTTFLNHRFEVLSGVMEKESADLLRNFFQSRRS